MEKILFINACIRSDSRTLELANCILEKLSKTVEEIKLYEKELSPLTLKEMELRENASRSKDFSNCIFNFPKQFAAADTIVIAAPYWDLMFPSVLKIYLENITVSGITFRYSDQGRPESLCRAKSLYYVTTAGGFIGQNDFGFSYVKALAQNFFGIPEIYRYTAEGLDIFGADVEQIMCKAKAAITSETSEHTIPYPEKYGNCPALDGASSFGGMADHSQSRYYVANDYFCMKSDRTLHILSKFQTYQQTTEYTCGAASVLMVLNWFGQKQYHEKAVAGLLETHCSRGSSVESVVDLFDVLGWKVDFHASTERRFQSIEAAEKAIIDYIDRGIPIMVDWVDWAGHWQVLIGIDTCGTDTPYDDVLIFADPYDVTDHKQDGYYTYPLGRFFSMWREGPCAEKSLPYQQPFVAVWPKKL